MGIGDVTEPLAPACVSAMQNAVNETLFARGTFPWLWARAGL